MNRKNVFRKVCERAMVMTRHAATQDLDFEGQPYGEPTCAYRSNFGPCLIGHLITDDAYNEDIEHNGIDEDVVIEALKASGIVLDNKNDIDLLNDIQKAHDSVSFSLKGHEFKRTLRQHLKYVAKNHSIPFPKFYKAI